MYIGGPVESHIWERFIIEAGQDMVKASEYLRIYDANPKADAIAAGLQCTGAASSVSGPFMLGPYPTACTLAPTEHADESADMRRACCAGCTATLSGHPSHHILSKWSVTFFSEAEETLTWAVMHSHGTEDCPSRMDDSQHHDRCPPSARPPIAPTISFPQCERAPTANCVFSSRLPVFHRRIRSQRRASVYPQHVCVDLTRTLRPHDGGRAHFVD
jgi:hypothetical protein